MQVAGVHPYPTCYPVQQAGRQLPFPFPSCSSFRVGWVVELVGDLPAGRTGNRVRLAAGRTSVQLQARASEFLSLFYSNRYDMI